MLKIGILIAWMVVGLFLAVGYLSFVRTELQRKPGRRDYIEALIWLTLWPVRVLSILFGVSG